METLEILTFVAMWCGNPAHFPAIHYTASDKLDKTTVQACRLSVVECLGDKPKEDKLKKCALDRNFK